MHGKKLNTIVIIILWMESLGAKIVHDVIFFFALACVTNFNSIKMM